jgi:dipeptidase E
VPRLTEELMSLGLSVEYFDFDAQSSDTLFRYDVIEIMGGNPFYLLKRMKETNCGEMFRQFAKDRVVIGLSAGSIVLQQSIELIAGYSPEMNNEVGMTDFSGLGLAFSEVLPHYHKYIPRFDNFEERAKQYEAVSGKTVFRIDDGQALFICGERQYIV